MATQTKKSPTFGTANAPAAAPPQRRLIGPKQLADKGVFYNLNHLRRMWADGRFPPPIHTSERRIAWPEEVIDRWIDERIAASAAEVA